MDVITRPTGFFEMTNPTPSHDAENDVDVALMRRIATGDERAFRTLVERHQGIVVGVVAKMLKDATEAEDIAQRVFLRVWKHAARWRPEAKFTTYLFTIARNMVYNESRRRSRRREISSDERSADRGLEPETDPAARPDAEALRSERQREIDDVIASLPEAQRTAVILYSYESMPYEEIAKVLGTSVPSVKSLLFRARGTLREKLSHLLGY